MTPMRTAFLEIENFLAAPAPETRRSEWINLLHRLIHHARDTEEAGLAVTFAAAGVIYMDAMSQVEPLSKRQHQDWLSNESLNLRAAITLRKPRTPAANTNAMFVPSRITA